MVQDSPAYTISVALCTYNGEKYLRAQLQSIAEQSLMPTELVICDDCSTDSTVQIAQHFQREAPFAVRIVVNPTNLGYTGNFEKAIELCSGDFIALCDQDDLWYPRKLAILSQILSKDQGIGGVFSDADLISQTGVPTGFKLWQRYGFTSREQARFQRTCEKVLMRRNVVTGMTLMIRSDLRSRLLPIPRAWIHDGWLAWMLCLNSTLIACPERLSAYRVHSLQQVGPPPGLLSRLSRAWQVGIPAYLMRARKQAFKDYSDFAQQFDVLARYLLEKGTPDSVPLAEEAMNKAAHCRRVLHALSQSRLLRMSLLLEARDYWRFSLRRLRVMFRDMVL